jgi:hypothetical protein
LLRAGNALESQHNGTTSTPGAAEELAEESLCVRKGVVVADEEDVRVQGLAERCIAGHDACRGSGPVAIALLVAPERLAGRTEFPVDARLLTTEERALEGECVVHLEGAAPST